ncbi:hypothetical protein Holit_02192 [Hollandina sp. SP2]
MLGRVIPIRGIHGARLITPSPRFARLRPDGCFDGCSTPKLWYVTQNRNCTEGQKFNRSILEHKDLLLYILER